MYKNKILIIDSNSPIVGQGEVADIKFPILYQDDDCLVIDKPFGVMVHPVDKPVAATVEATEETETEDEDIIEQKEAGEYVNATQDTLTTSETSDPMSTISDWMGEAYPSSRDIDNNRPGIVHRLDRDTSGCLLLIKEPKVFGKYKSQFQEHTVKKVYWAIVAGVIKDDTGIIDTPIARAKSDFRKKEVKNEFSKDYRGVMREALTRYKVLERYKCPTGAGYTLIECLPTTGRTHQIRVHLRSIRHPIVGDKLYGSKDSAQMTPRQMLHAKSLEFTTFIKDIRGNYKSQKIKVQSAMPSDMLGTLEKIKQMC